MEAIIMSAGTITAIVLSVIGIIKLPFNKFKNKHPKWFKAIFTLLSIALTFGACLINQAFIIETTKLFNADFIIILLTTYAGVFGLYHSYEGLGLKDLVKKLVGALKDVKAKAPESKIAKGVAKLEKKAEKLGFNISVNVVKAEKADLTEVAVENAVVENQVINAEKVEINNAEVHNSTINQ